jgi:L-serine deaminase
MKISGGLRLEKKLIDDIICKVAEEVESHNVGLTMFATKKGRKYQEDLLKMVHVRAIEKAVASTIKELKQQTTKQYIEKADAVKE